MIFFFLLLNPFLILAGGSSIFSRDYDFSQKILLPAYSRRVLVAIGVPGSYQSGASPIDQWPSSPGRRASGRGLLPLEVLPAPGSPPPQWTTNTTDAVSMWGRR